MAFDPIEFSEHVMFSAESFRAEVTAPMQRVLRMLLSEEIEKIRKRLSDADIILIFETAKSVHSEAVATYPWFTEDMEEKEKFLLHIELAKDLYGRILGILPNFTSGGELMAIFLEWIRLTPERDAPIETKDMPF